ncbi:MAG: DUF3099 domain-containing protein [Streptomycetaceae bacterium]|nr:DUF3099 domain-containing protein [Streptomycetaceae bacterium]
MVNRERGAKAAKAPVYRISGARKGLSEDVRGRQRRYVVSMSVRTVCFLLAVIFSGPLRWVFLAGALLLPYIAVVVANAGREPTSDPPLPRVVPQTHRAIEAPPEAVLTGSERTDIRVVPEDAWIVPDAPAEPGGKAPGDEAGDAPPGRSDGPPEGNRQ